MAGERAAALLLVDSTELKLDGAGEWFVEKQDGRSVGPGGNFTRIFADAGYQGPKAPPAVADTGSLDHRDPHAHNFVFLPKTLDRRTNRDMDNPLPPADAKLRPPGSSQYSSASP
jgi:hypothetical protein